MPKDNIRQPIPLMIALSQQVRKFRYIYQIAPNLSCIANTCASISAHLSCECKVDFKRGLWRPSGILLFNQKHLKPCSNSRMVLPEIWIKMIHIWLNRTYKYRTYTGTFIIKCNCIAALTNCKLIEFIKWCNSHLWNPCTIKVLQMVRIKAKKNYLKKRRKKESKAAT